MKAKRLTVCMIILLLFSFISPVLPVNSSVSINPSIVYAKSETAEPTEEEIMEEPELETINGNYNTIVFLITMAIVLILVILFILSLIYYFKKKKQ